MEQYLDVLINLQGVDLRIKDHNDNIKRLQKEKEVLQQAWLKYQEELEQLKAGGEQVQKKRRKSELELESKETEVKKYKGQMLNVKTNREYQSLLHEIDQAKAAGEKIEEEILKLMEAGDELQHKIKEYKQKFKVEQQRVEQQQQELQALLDKHKQEKQALQKERGQLKQGIKNELAANYEKLLQNKAGIAITLAKDGVCQGCFIRITPQTYEEIKKREKIYNCPSCCRMLYTENRLITEDTSNE